MRLEPSRTAPETELAELDPALLRIVEAFAHALAWHHFRLAEHVGGRVEAPPSDREV